MHYRDGALDKQPRDIAGVRKIRGGELDHAHLDEWAGLLGVDAEWRELLRRVAE